MLLQHAHTRTQALTPHACTHVHTHSLCPGGAILSPSHLWAMVHVRMGPISERTRGVLKNRLRALTSASSPAAPARLPRPLQLAIPSMHRAPSLPRALNTLALCPLRLPPPSPSPLPAELGPSHSPGLGLDVPWKSLLGEVFSDPPTYQGPSPFYCISSQCFQLNVYYNNHIVHLLVSMFWVGLCH